MPRLLLIYGLSGSGKSTAARILEDAGIQVIRNIPAVLLRESFVKATKIDSGDKIFAISPELASREDVAATIVDTNSLKNDGYRVTQIFLTADDAVLLKRYKESRRPHPLGIQRSLLESIHLESSILKPLCDRSDFIVTTDALNQHELAQELFKCAAIDVEKKMQVTFTSFGFKFGIPRELDLCFDVRFLRNPFFTENLKEMSGLDIPIQEFVMGENQAIKFLEKMSDMLDFLMPLYAREGKNYLTVGIGCTGGRHRSVVIADRLFDSRKENFIVASIVHRDVHREV